MGGRRTRSSRRWATMALAALGLVTVGSWCVVSAATGSTDLHATGSAGLADALHPVRPNVTVPITIPPAPVADSMAPVTPSSLAPVDPPPAAVISIPRTPPSTAPLSSTPRQRRAPSHPAASPVMAPASSETARVAVDLISAINLQARGKVKIPPSAQNVALLGRWMANEGGLWANNPLNTSMGSGANPHQRTSGGADTGIPVFSTMNSGVEATATTLLSNPSYARILRVLRSGRASCLAFATAVVRSPWASGHYDHDPSGFCSGRIVARQRGHGHRRAK
jgi:hypothetical protein